MSDPQHVDDAIAQSRSNMSDRQRVTALRGALSQCQKVLATLVETPNASVSGITIATAYAQCKAAEMIARSTLTATATTDK